MAKYTTQVRTICEISAGLTDNVGFDDVDEVITKAIPKVFNFNFPIFDEAYREHLCYEILLRNYTKEIAHETVGLWKLRLKARLHEIMPYYNQMYKSELLQFNPFYDVDLERTHKKTGEDTTVSNGNILNEESNSLVVDNTFQNSKSGDKSATTEYSEDVKGNNEYDLSTKDITTASNTNTVDSKNVTAQETETSDVKNLENINRKSDTPQGMIADIKNNTYLTEAVIDNADETVKRTATDSTEVDSTVLESGESKNTKDVTAKNTETLVNNVNSDSKNTENFSESSQGTANTQNVGSKTGNTNTVNNVNLTSIEDYIESVKGKNGGKSYSELLNEFRTTFLNIDKMVINDLAELFCLLW